MRKFLYCLMISSFPFSAPVFGQRQDLSLMLGSFNPANRTLETKPPLSADIASGMAFYVNYGVRLAQIPGAALYLEVPFVASPSHKISAATGLATRELATLYLTPGVRLKFLPGSRISPYVAAGGGYALFEQSNERIDGQPNGAVRRTSSGAFDFGGGVDIKIWRFVSLRGEVRDFLSGSPDFNLPVRGKQHNVLVSGGFAIRF